ncbi:MAG: Unknown protein [uncultured Sulfurovum sp.]|uniref:Cytoplasmic protein n=1 Tax=uncultured Sulfurovum sp. TaxID=269237 RepID=A0A6S6SYU4_9BACT|nr:MAG: Unknown protein [uncultured Sulfurovum sp.]
MEKSQKNKGRNVINIEEIKEYLHNFSKEKKLSEPINTWLQKTFVRWLINHFMEVEIVESVERYKTLVNAELPYWFTPHSSIQFIYIHIKNPTFVDTLNTCVEFLGSRSEKIAHKFPRMTIEHVMEKHRQEHLRMQERQRKYIETSNEALEKVFSFENMHVVKFLPEHKELSLEMARESALMQHCLGEFDNVEKAEGGYGSYYYGLIKSKEISLYSLRDEKNKPHATISVSYKRGEAWLDQIKGKQNQAPVPRYVPASIAFFNHLNLQQNYHADCLAMNVVFAKGKSQELSKITDEATQQHLIAYDPSFINKLPNPSKSSLWLVALRDPKQMETLKKTTNAMKIASLIQHPLLLNELKFSHNIKAKKILQQKENYNISEYLFVFPKLEIARI